MPKQPSTNPVRRGDIVLVPFPNSDLRTVKIRPALVVQSDDIDSDLSQVLLVMNSSNLRRIGRKTRYVIEIDTESGVASGLLVDSVVMTDNFATVLRSRIIRILRSLNSMMEVDNALRHSLNL